MSGHHGTHSVMPDQQYSQRAGQRLRAVTYSRISLDRREGAGVERQQEDTRKVADLHNLDVAAELVENSVSAWSGKNRPEYTRLLDMIRDNQVDRVIVWHTDRLHRNVGELVSYLDLTRSRGVKTLAVQGNGYDPESSDGRFLATVLGAVAEQESDHKSERVKRAIRQAREQGRPRRDGGRMFGYEPDGMTLVETEAQFLRRAADRVIAGHSLRRICLDAQDEGITTVRGKPMNTSALRRLLCNPYMAGLSSLRSDDRADMHREVVGQGQWAPVFDVEVHEQVVAALTHPSRRVNREGNAAKWLLTGIATCPCGGVVNVSRSRPNAAGERVPQYRCVAKTKQRIPGPHVSRQCDSLDAYVTSEVFRRIATMDLGEYLRTADEGEGKIAGLLADRERLEMKLETHESRYLDLHTDRELAQWDRLNRATLDALDEVNRAIDDAAGDRSAVAQLAGVSDVAAWWRDVATLDDQRAIVRELVTVELLPMPRGTKGFHPEYVDVQPRPRRNG